MFLHFFALLVSVENSNIKLPHHLYTYIVSGNIYTIVPVTQYVYLNDTVKYECATNLTGYSLFLITQGSECLESHETLDNGGMIVSCSLTASSEANGTQVTCYAPNENASEPA